MEERITWSEIDASPLLQLSCQERAQLREVGDERFRAFWDACYRAYIANRPDTDNVVFCTIFTRVFTSYQPNPAKPGQTFSVYLRSAVKHEQARFHATDTDTPRRFGRETYRKVKTALEYMAKADLSMGRVCSDPELLETVAAVAEIGSRTLRTALQESQALIRLDATEEGDGQIDLPDPTQEDFALQLERQHTFSLLHRGISLMTLKAKEDFGDRFGTLFSSSLLGVLRCDDKVSPAENAPDRLAACDEFRPMEKDNCLWDILLMRSYVDFTICPPHKEHTMDELPCAAMNPLCSPERLPHQDKTVAEFLGVSKAAVSQRKRTMTARLRALLDKAERSE